MVRFLLALMVVGCLYDPHDRCGDHQRIDDRDTCVCDESTVPIDGRCQSCPEGEVISGDACACPPDLVRVAGTCVAPPDGQGLTCSATVACTTAADPLCTAVGYCSRACASTADCAGDYACDLVVAMPYCERPPSGLDLPCTAQEDCASYEASYCETSYGHVCLVAGCAVDDPDACFPGWGCCDLTSLGFTTTLCVPEGQCPT